ncbi:hypothetical protein BGZ50_006773 [Haplosporangium sp. Z 11]|nr:hypothetical protein BGZ50_006773 [Haplosporangium sp. Z 11]
MELNERNNNISFEENGIDAPKAEPYSQILDRTLWTRKEYLILCAGVLFQAFAYSFESNMFYSVLGYVTAFFTATSLVSILPTILQILKAALVPFYIKVSDVFGRAESLTFAIFFYLLGFTIQGTTNSFVQLAIGQIFYGMGSTGVYTLTQVLIADTTKLIDRGIMFALWDMPTVISIFLAQVLTDPLTIPKQGEQKDKWREAYILMGVLSLVGALVLMVPLWRLQTKAKRLKTRRFERRSFKWLLHEFDAIGAILITAAMSLLLLPMILANSYEGNWRNGKILGMFIAGIIFLVLLVLWEAKYTDRPIMSMKIWSNRTAFGGLVVGFVFAIMSSVNYQYYTVYLVVSRELTFGRALLLERGYPIAWLIFQLITAFLMKRYNTCRVGLMIPARAPTSSDAFVVISQAIAGAGAGVANVASSVAVTGVVLKKDIATVIGTSQVLASIGYALGGALAGGVWTQYLPKRLAIHITGPYDEHLAMNDPLTYITNLDPTTRSQLIDAYADSQMLMSIITCCLAVIACICTLMMKHVDLRKDQAEQDREATDGPESPAAEKAMEMK